MIVEKILRMLFGFGGVLSHINIDLPPSAFTAVRGSFNSFAVLGQLIDLSQVLYWTLLVIGFQIYLSIFTFIVKLIRG